MPKILVLGGTGYIGSAFVDELRARGWDHRVLRRSELDYTQFPLLVRFLRAERFDFLVNCAGYSGKPNVDTCEIERADTLLGNVTLPLTIAHACAEVQLPWGQVSSGCIYSGARVANPDGSTRIERNLMEPRVYQELQEHPERFTGFTEEDVPNFTFRNPPCSFYSGTKALGEEVLAGLGNYYIWRLRIPFDAQDHSRNFLSKVQRYSRVYDNVNSITHRGEFAQASLDLWLKGAAFGIYNVANPGWVTTRDIVAKIQKRLQPGKTFEFWRDDQEFYAVAAKTPRSNCLMDVSKLLAAGIHIRPIEQAIDEALRDWQPEKR
jgi:dTDP-4-dehydrorhamnose reductase